MIKAKIYRNKNNEPYGFVIKNHGQSIVCSAVSALSQNTCNSIECLTDATFKINAKKIGYLAFKLTETENLNKKALLLLNSLVLGLKGIEKEHAKQIQVINVGGAVNVKD
ncbi:MAG: ribosomal-processing cysteine protease Prp [Clostridiales bacterium]|jgi:uncharacterized protein YsxB (DUF464 family)|nr:ribosomal-processing cysteine protease Prp [Clostridiales bacterium]